MGQVSFSCYSIEHENLCHGIFLLFCRLDDTSHI